MARLAMRNPNGSKMVFSGTAYENPSHGNRRICLRTGPGTNDIVKYGLTSDNSASQYCRMKFRLPDGRIGRIGRYETATSMSNGTGIAYTRQSYTKEGVSTTTAQNMGYKTVNKTSVSIRTETYEYYETLTHTVTHSTAGSSTYTGLGARRTGVHDTGEQITYNAGTYEVPTTMPGTHVIENTYPVTDYYDTSYTTSGNFPTYVTNNNFNL